MKVMNGRLVVIAGVALTLMALLAFSFATPSTALGGEPDTGLQTDGDVGAGAQPPASLPAAGAEGVAPADSSTSTLFVMLLAALGVTLTGAGFMAARHRQQATDE